MIKVASISIVFAILALCVCICECVCVYVHVHECVCLLLIATLLMKHFLYHPCKDKDANMTYKLFRDRTQEIKVESCFGSIVDLN